MRFIDWMACRPPLDQVVGRGEQATTRLASLDVSRYGGDLGVVGALDRDDLGQPPGGTRTNGSPRYDREKRLVIASAPTPASTCAKHVAKMPARERCAHRHEPHRASGAPASKSARAISGMCWCSSGLYVRRLFARTGWCVPALGATPLPLIP